MADAVTTAAPAAAAATPLCSTMQTLGSAHAALLRTLPDCPMQLPRTAVSSARKPPRHTVTNTTSATAAAAAAGSTLPPIGASSGGGSIAQRLHASNNNNNNNSNNNERELASKAMGVFSVSAAAQLLRIGQLDMDVRLDFVTANRVVAVFEKAIERLQLLCLVHGGAADSDATTHDDGVATTTKTLPPPSSSQQQQHNNNAHDSVLYDHLMATTASPRDKPRCAATYAGPSGVALGATATAVTAALAAATQSQQRGRPTVAQRMQAQQQLEARYGALLLATRHDARAHDTHTSSSSSSSAITTATFDVSCLTHARNDAQTALLRELHRVAARLRDHNKLLCTQLLDNPNDADNWNKIRNERAELCALLRAAVAELMSGYHDAAAAPPPSHAAAAVLLSSSSSSSLSHAQQQPHGSSSSPPLSRRSSLSQLPHTRGDVSVTRAGSRATTTTTTTRHGGSGGGRLTRQHTSPSSRRNSNATPRRPSLPSTSSHATAYGGGGGGSDTESVTNTSSSLSPRTRALPSAGAATTTTTTTNATPATNTLTRRFGSTMHLHRSTRRTATRPRVPLTSSFAHFARTVLQEQTAQRWADALVRKERELNQNVKQLQSDLLRERAAMAQEVQARSARVAQLQAQLRELRATTQARLADARAAIEAAMHGVQRDAADAERVVADAAAASTRTLRDEAQTHALFAEHLRQRTAAADALAVAWERKNALELTHRESAKLDAEQTRQQCAEHLATCKRNELVQLELQKQRRRARARAQARRDAAEARREAEYDAASVLQAAIAGMLTRQALAKLLKTGSGGGGGGKKKKKKQ